MLRLSLSLLVIHVSMATGSPLHSQQNPPINEYFQPEWLSQGLVQSLGVKKVIFAGPPHGDMPLSVMKQMPKDSTVVEFNAEGKAVLVARYSVAKGQEAKLAQISIYQYSEQGLPASYTQFRVYQGKTTPEYVYYFHHDRAGRLLTRARWSLRTSLLVEAVDSTVFCWTDDGQLAREENYYNHKPGGWKPSYTTSYYFDDSCHLFLRIGDDHSSIEDSTFIACDAQGRITREWKTYVWAKWLEGGEGTEEEMQEGHRATLLTSYEYDAGCLRKVSRSSGIDPTAMQAQFTLIEMEYDERGLAFRWRHKKKSNPAREFPISYEYFP